MPSEPWTIDVHMHRWFGTVWLEIYVRDHAGDLSFIERSQVTEEMPTARGEALHLMARALEERATLLLDAPDPA